jgi:hypothetical protein
MAIQAWQLRKLYLQNKEIDLIWEQIGILAMTTGLNIEKLQKSIDEKESKPKV